MSNPGSDMRAVGGGSLGECESCEHPFNPDEDSYDVPTDGYPRSRRVCTGCAWERTIEIVAEEAENMMDRSYHVTEADILNDSGQGVPGPVLSTDRGATPAEVFQIRERAPYCCGCVGGLAVGPRWVYCAECLAEKEGPPPMEPPTDDDLDAMAKTYGEDR